MRLVVGCGYIYRWQGFLLYWFIVTDCSCGHHFLYSLMDDALAECIFCYSFFCNLILSIVQHHHWHTYANITIVLCIIYCVYGEVLLGYHLWLWTAKVFHDKVCLFTHNLTVLWLMQHEWIPVKYFMGSKPWKSSLVFMVYTDNLQVNVYCHSGEKCVWREPYGNFIWSL